MVSARHALFSAAAATATVQMAWTIVQAADQLPLGSAEGEVGRNVGDEPVGAEEVAGGGDAVVPVADTQDPNAEALVVVVTTSPPAETIAPQLPADGDGEGEEPVEPSVEEPTIDLDNASANAEQQDTQAPTMPAKTEVPVSTQPPTTEAPADPETTQPVAIVEVTIKPSLRTQEPAVISEAVTNDAADTHAPGYLDQGINPVVLMALAGICCIFLLLWGRKRRSTGATTTASASGGAGSKGPKVAYTQVPDEQPFSHSQDDDDEYCDDYEEDTFANDRDNWDDWEGNASSPAQVPQLNPFVAAAPSPPRPTTPRQNKSSPSPFQLSQPLPPPPQHTQLQEVAIAGKGDLLPSSVESNSSSDSFEVVTDEAHMPPTSNRSASAPLEKESESVDDLFSQFGMVPTFKKSAVVPPPPAATTSAAPAMAATTTTSALPTAAEASALFAAEMDDELTAVDAADEWGEDDEWVKGI